ncbi:MAG TPA: radical SAM protein [Povalibacter sp.]|nr:radical SAM protein [Povalibacter sp.]
MTPFMGSATSQADRKVLLINPRITSRRHARFPLSLLSLAARIADTHRSRIIDGNTEEDCVAATLRALDDDHYDAAGITVMGGPQVATAIQVSRAIREKSPHLPIVWGGYFPTLFRDAALNAPYVDYLVRGQGEEAFCHLLQSLLTGSDPAAISGLSYKRDSVGVHTDDGAFTDRRAAQLLPYELLGDPRRYLVRTFLGQRTAAHQAALGCRFRCTFCGVAAMFGGAVALPTASRLERDLAFLRDRIGADSIQFFDHNFFDREADMVPLLEVLARFELPWWCYARADALLNLSPRSWSLVRKSRLRMAYIGAESPNDALLRSIRKGTNANQTLAVADLCRRQGVIPELSFMVAPPHDPEGETERTFDFIREVKRVNPHAEIIVYIYTPLPEASLHPKERARGAAAPLLDSLGNPVHFPETPEEWTQQRWVDYACHADAPWMSAALRKRIRDFVTVLGCRFPTVQDVRAPTWAKATLRGLAAWRYVLRRYDQPWELNLTKRVIRLTDPRVTSI